MQNEEQQSLKHDFTFGGGPSNSYYFANGLGILYEVMFKPSGYLFPNDPAFNNDVYEFVIRIEENIVGINPPPDPLLPPTIAAIFRNFFKREGAVIVYICDSADGRQAVRFRKFNSWYSYFESKGSPLMKIDLEFDDNGHPVYTSLLLLANHPLFPQIIAAYQKLVLWADNDTK
ncbi:MULTISPECIES: DUF6169 family protein [unclassified Spirosoma]|uniref:DUF6169 family protein n=1 Tax=unclassified Spirosoma TaxID=2621999 RepID=UPI0009651318|nr:MULTISPECIES: DUF6169 family protein [unclassified Spirosoma]MBN8823122.1 hypothetical protein [Spirosoma sp.]OJW73211.1 MAG: hypothetical protein BGO59_06925 [Spirosoma sp. 48-14]